MTVPIIHCKEFVSLTLSELYRLLALRQAVFIVEQNCPYLDADGLDEKAWHLFISDDDTGELIACTRVLPPGLVYPKQAAIGRMVVHPQFRRRNLARQMMTRSIALCRQLYGETGIKISAQSYLTGFYASCGFAETGEQYLEDGIPHSRMILST